MNNNAPVIDFEPLMKPHWTTAQRQNVTRVAEFIQLLMNNHDFDAVLDRFEGSHYVQHNRNIPEGIPGLIGYVKDTATRFPEYSYDVKRIEADGETVTFHSHATLRSKHRGDDRQGFNIIDTWKVVDGQIADHWDAIQPLSFSMRLFSLFVGGRIANSNGVF